MDIVRRTIVKVDPCEVEEFVCPKCKRRMKQKWDEGHVFCFACMVNQKVKSDEYPEREHKLED